MKKRDLIKSILAGEKPPYTPWSFRLTQEAEAKLKEHFKEKALPEVMHNHILELGSDIGFFNELGGGFFRDVFGVIWDRNIDKDIGDVKGTVLSRPILEEYEFPNPLDPRFFADIEKNISQNRDSFRLYCLGFSLFERAWALRGMENLMVDFNLHPTFVHDLLGAIADYNITQIQGALKYDIDAIYFGDDWGQQKGLLMGYPIWKEFIFPELKRMYAPVREAGKYIFIHSCGDVRELFDDLIEIGLSCFNPFQPEVMDVERIYETYHGRLSFWGGLSVQKTLPFGSVDKVSLETSHLIEMGRRGSYILSPSHSVTGDVPLENILSVFESVQAQPGWQEAGHSS